MNREIPCRIKQSAAVGVLIAFCFMVILRLVFTVNGENDVDPFYHVRIAMEGWSVYTAQTFPTMTLSTWSECFADKELLFHILLSGVQNAVLALGLPDFPFHVPNLFFLFLILLAFACAGIRYRVRGLWVLIPFLFCLCGVFTFRAMMLRPHLLSIALMLLSCAVYPSIRTLRDAWIAVLLGIVFVWGYSNPHFLLFSAGAFSVAYFLKDRKRGILLLGSTLVGLLFGFLLHPQNPNTFINWKIQCIDVPLMLFTGKQESFLADELMYSGFHIMKTSFLFCLPLIILFLGNIGLSISLFFRRRRVFFQPEILAVMMLGFMTMIGFCGALRFIEYAMPFNLLLFGVLFSRVVRIPKEKRRVGALPSVLALSLCAFGVWMHHYEGMEYFTRRPATHLAKWFASFGDSVPRGLVLGNLNWSDFPQLYYAMPQMRYLCGLDPTFGYVYKTEITTKLQAFCKQKIDLSPEDLANLIGTPIFYLSFRDSSLAKKMYVSGYRMIYLGADGRLFTSLGHGNLALPQRKNSPENHK